MAKTHQVLTSPAAGTQIHPTFHHDEEQKAKLQALSEYAHTQVLPDSDPYHKWEIRWLTMPDTLPRYMRSAKWDLEDAKKRIKATILWRRDYKPDLIPPDEVRIESETGKIVINGFDKDGRPIIYMRPGLENTQRSPRQLRHLVWCLERAKDLMPPGQESLVIIVDYKSCSLRTNPSISVARQTLHILQQHYVETLGRALVVNLPRILSFFYTGISPFLDPVTRDKMRFNPDLRELIPKEQLDSAFGGDFEYEFEPVSYWEQIVSACGIAEDGTRVTEKDGPEVVDAAAVHTPTHNVTATAPSVDEKIRATVMVEEAAGSDREDAVYPVNEISLADRTNDGPEGVTISV